MSMIISLFDNAQDNDPKQVETTWDEVVDQLSTHDRTPCAPCVGHKCGHKNGTAFSLVSYDGPRGLQGVVNVYALVLDFDRPSADTVDRLEAELEGLQHAIYSTHSYDGDTNLSLRVVIPLSEPVPASKWAKFWRSVVNTLGLPADESCSDASRLFFAPSAPINAPVFFQSADGVPLDISSVTVDHSNNERLLHTRNTAVTSSAVDGAETFDLDHLRQQLKRGRSPGASQLVRMVCAGEPLPEGAHDSTLNRVAWVFARYLPLSTPLEVLVELLRPTLQATECDEGMAHHVDEFADMWERAKKARDEGFKQELSDASMVREAVAGRSLQQQKPAMIFVVPWEQWVYELNGEWQVGNPVGARGAKRRLEDGGFIAAALDKVPADSSEADALRDVKALEKHPLVQTVYKIECAPNEPEFFRAHGNQMLNQWRPPTLESVPGTFPSIQRVVDYLTMSDGIHDPEGSRWLLHWMAAKVQNPGHTRLTAPVFHGTPGSGKNTLLRPFMESLGMANCATVKQKDLESDFNAHFVNRLFVFADDCVPAGSLRSLSEQLKTYITGDTVFMNAKGVKQLEITNRAAWLFTSNNENPLIVEKDDRRYTVFSNKLAITPEWRAFCRSLWVTGKPNMPTEKFWGEMRAFKDYLEKLVVDWDFIDLPYSNSARNEIIEANLDSRDSFVREVEAVGFSAIASMSGVYMPPDEVKHSNGYLFSYMYRVYQKWSEHSGYRPVSKKFLGMKLRRVWERKETPSVVYFPPDRPVERVPANERAREAVARA